MSAKLRSTNALTVTQDWTTQLIRPPGLPTRLRVATKIAGFLLLTLPLMPVQAVLIRTWPAGARRLPHWYHGMVCRILGVRVKVEGRLADAAPVLLVANHTSWLDIPVISAAAPVSFVAKKEVAGWPFVSWLAKLQRSVFVDRTRRTSVGGTTDTMMERLAAGDNIVLFAEGTSSDGARVLPFKTSLLAAAKPSRSMAPDGSVPRGTVVQTLALVYTHLHGLPIGRGDRPTVGWYGDMELPGHVFDLLASTPVDAIVRLGEPVPIEAFQDRKELARHGEDEVRAQVIDLLRSAGRQPK